jgi:hypothetical protein
MNISSTNTDITHYAVRITSGTIIVHANDSRLFEMVMTLLSAFQYNDFKLCCILFVFHKSSIFPNIPTETSLS